MIKKTLFLFLLLSVYLHASSPPQVNDGLVILKRSLEELNLDRPIGPHSFSPEGIKDVLKNKEELNLPTYGEPSSDKILVTLIGYVRDSGHYYLPQNGSAWDALDNGKQLLRLSTSRFILRRNDTYFLIYAGRAHSVAPIAKDVLPLIQLQDGDILWTSAVLPY